MISGSVEVVLVFIRLWDTKRFWVHSLILYPVNIPGVSCRNRGHCNVWHWVVVCVWGVLIYVVNQLWSPSICGRQLQESFAMISMLCAEHQVLSFKVTLFNLSLRNKSSRHQLFSEPCRFLFILYCEIDQANPSSSRWHDPDSLKVHWVQMFRDVRWSDLLFVKIRCERLNCLIVSSSSGLRGFSSLALTLMIVILVVFIELWHLISVSATLFSFVIVSRLWDMLIGSWMVSLR